MMIIYLQFLLTIVIGAKGETFDYVIAGAGTAGLVVANRLSENPNITVAVIEPGDDVRHNPNVTTIEDSGIYFNASIDWQYYSTPQATLGNRTLLYHAGKAIGGSSNINGMVYIRGDKAQFDAWEHLGNEGWNWDTLFPYFKRSENFTTPTAAQVANGATYDELDHGQEGFLKTGFPFQLSNGSFHNIARKTWERLGVLSKTDLNGGTTQGYSAYPQTIDRDANVREDAARAYYQPVESRPNLKILKSTVKRVIWVKGNSPEIVADGLEIFNLLGNVTYIKARKEVILSAGAYRTPLILESSGVGNPSVLEKLGIDVKIRLPGVGASMQDQHLTTMAYDGIGNITGYIPYVTMATAHDLFGNNSLAMAASTNLSISKWAHIASVALDGAISSEALETRFRVQHDLIFNKNVTIAEIFSTATGNILSSAFWILMPFSWGSVHLGSQAAINKPVIDPRPLSVDFDLEMLTGAGRLSQKLWNTQPLSDLIIANIVPGASVLPLNATEDQWSAYIRTGLGTTWHVIGTCSMMSRELGGVVNPNLTVYGTRNVRVVDASAIPMQISGHTTATLYAVAEKASALIKDTWN